MAVKVIANKKNCKEFNEETLNIDFIYRAIQNNPIEFLSNEDLELLCMFPTKENVFIRALKSIYDCKTDANFMDSSNLTKFPYEYIQKEELREILKYTGYGDSPMAKEFNMLLAAYILNPHPHVKMKKAAFLKISNKKIREKLLKVVPHYLGDIMNYPLMLKEIMSFDYKERYVNDNNHDQFISTISLLKKNEDKVIFPRLLYDIEGMTKELTQKLINHGRITPYEAIIEHKRVVDEILDEIDFRYNFTQKSKPLNKIERNRGLVSYILLGGNSTQPIYTEFNRRLVHCFEINMSLPTVIDFILSTSDIDKILDYFVFDFSVSVESFARAKFSVLERIMQWELKNRKIGLDKMNAILTGFIKRILNDYISLYDNDSRVYKWIRSKINAQIGLARNDIFDEAIDDLFTLLPDYKSNTSAGKRRNLHRNIIRFLFSYDFSVSKKALGNLNAKEFSVLTAELDMFSTFSFFAKKNQMTIISTPGFYFKDNKNLKKLIKSKKDIEYLENW